MKSRKVGSYKNDERGKKSQERMGSKQEAPVQGHREANLEGSKGDIKTKGE